MKRTRNMRPVRVGPESGAHGPLRRTMGGRRKIVIWDNDAERSAEIAGNLCRAMHTAGCRYELEQQSEAPLMARMGVWSNMPVLEAEGCYWTWKAGESIPEEAAIRLLRGLEQLRASRAD